MMFKTPTALKEVTIMGEKIPITISSWKCNQEEADGLCINKHIYLREIYEDKIHFERVLSHECFHALCEIIGCQLDIHMEETLAHLVSLNFTFNILVSK